MVHCRSLPPRHGAPHTLLTPPHSSLLLHRYLLYPQPNVIGLRSILRNCFPPVAPSPSVTFTYLLCFPRIVILAHVSVSPVQRCEPEVQCQQEKSSEPLRSNILYFGKICFISPFNLSKKSTLEKIYYLLLSYKFVIELTNTNMLRLCFKCSLKRKLIMLYQVENDFTVSIGSQ